MIWIIGDKGMLGSELSRLLVQEHIEHTGSGSEVDILDPRAISDFAARNTITAMVNCAAYTAVDKAEDEPVLCARLNVEGPANLASLADRIGARFIHISTDYVFAGDASTPYREEDPVNPIGIYGRTKAEGEKAVMVACPGAIILRTSWLYGEFGANFVFAMLKQMREREELGVVSDQLGTPTWTRNLSRAIAEILASPTVLSGIYHYTDAGEISWYLFALEIYKLGRELGFLKKECRISPIVTAQYPARAKRPAYSVLSKEKIIADFCVEVPSWEKSLSRFLKEVLENEVLATRTN